MKMKRNRNKETLRKQWGGILRTIKKNKGKLRTNNGQLRAIRKNKDKIKTGSENVMKQLRITKKHKDKKQIRRNNEK